MFLKIPVFDLMSIVLDKLDIHFENDKSRNYKIIDKFLEKSTINFRRDFLKSSVIVLHVSDVDKSEIELHSSQVKQICDPWLVYLFCKIVAKDKMEILKKESSEPLYAHVCLLTYSKKGYEAKEFMSTLLTSFSSVDKGKQINIDRIESLLSKSDKKEYVKGVQESVTATLLGRGEDKALRIPKEAQNGIVAFSELGKALNIKDKRKKTQCPICKEKYMIDQSNLTKILFFKGETFIYKCDHKKSLEHIGGDPFEKDLSSYLPMSATNKEKSMFVLINFKHIAYST